MPASRSSPRFSRILIEPTFEPSAVPKQPHSISNPLKRLIPIAATNMNNKLKSIAEFSLTDIPNIRRIPAHNSTHGSTIAKKFTSKRGSNL